VRRWKVYSAKEGGTTEHRAEIEHLRKTVRSFSATVLPSFRALILILFFPAAKKKLE
jgi:hypothetical protein